MQMINFEYPALFLLVTLTFICGFVIAKFIRYNHFVKMAKIRILRRQQNLDVSFYSAEIIKNCVQKLFFSANKKAKRALAELIFGKTKTAEKFLAQKDKALSLLLKAHHDVKLAYTELKKNKKIWKNNIFYALLFASLAEKFFDYDSVRSSLKKISPKKLYGLNKALYNQISAVIYIRDADMLSASVNASSALKYFQKHDMPVEEAETYLILGEIYRMSCVNDVAQTMIESAIKIYEKFSLNLFEAQAKAVLGMLLVFGSRIEEAREKFDSALENMSLRQTKGEILNQIALLEIADKNFSKSFKAADNALEIHQKIKNKRGIALSMQILAHLYNNKNMPRKALDFANKAGELYLKQKNFSALCECLYLSATVYFKKNKFEKAEDILRRILKISEKYGVNFHHANAYGLLGLIYLKKNELQRAKVLIQQSLHLEQRNNRSFGMVADYANLALIENLSGDKESAEANLKIALEYALKSEDEELINLIKKQVKD